ncbi:MAG: hypothetical protein AABW87_02225, partial [Nanoarchaeota archaeon]
YLDETVPSDLKAVNIIVKREGRLVGYNTDSKGLYLSVREALEKIGKNVGESRVAIFGAGGVAKEFARELAFHGVKRIVLINRTFRKAVAIAHELNEKYGRDVAYAISEDMTRGAVLNTIEKLDAIVNCTDKGSDGPLVQMSAFAPADPKFNNTHSIDVLRLLKQWNPDVVVVDIVLPKSGRSVTLRHAESAGLENLVDGIPMVINQAAPAYKLVESAHPEVHAKTLPESEILKIMKEAAQ